MTLPTLLSIEDRRLLRQVLVGHFDLDELRLLTCDLGIDPELIDARPTNREVYAERLIAYCQRHATPPTSVGCLVLETFLRRPSLSDVDQMLNRVEPCGYSPAVRVVLSGWIDDARAPLGGAVPEDLRTAINALLDLSPRYPSQVVVNGLGVVAAMNTRRRVLVVDDNAEWRERIASTLRLELQREIEEAATYEEAMQKIRLNTNAYSLLVVDLRLVATDTADQSGLQLIEHARRMGVKAPCFLLSAHLTGDVVARTLAENRALRARPIEKGALSSPHFRRLLHEAVVTGESESYP